MMNFHDHNQCHNLTLSICLQQPILIPNHSANNVEINHGQHQNRMATYLTSILALLSFIVPMLLDLIDLKFKKDTPSAFEAYPTTTKLVVYGLLAFVLAFGLVSIFHTCHLSPIRAALFHTIMVLSTSFSLSSLTSLLFPNAFRPFLYVLFALLSLGNFYNLVWNGVTGSPYNHGQPPRTCITVIRRQWHVRRRLSTFSP